MVYLVEALAMHRILLLEYVSSYIEWGFDNHVLLLFPLVSDARTIFWQFWWWWPKAPSTGLADSCKARNTHQISLTAPPSLLQSSEFFDNLVLLLFPLLLMRSRFSGSSGGGGRKLPVQA